MNTALRALGILAGGFLLLSCAGPQRRETSAEVQRPDVDRVLDDLHDAAARADEERYFSLFAPDAIFLGTDATERWTLEQFREYARPIFGAGRGWTYVPQQRYIAFGPGGGTAWFDETLTNAKLGLCRGTGALVRGQDGRWRIAQYNLTVPVPNALVEDLARRIRESAIRDR